MRLFGTISLAGMLLAATASAQTLTRLDRTVVLDQDPVRLILPSDLEPQTYSNESTSSDSTTTRLAAPLPEEPVVAIDEPAQVWRSPDDPTTTSGPDHSHDKDFGFDEEYFGLEAGYGARAASIETRYDSDGGLKSEQDDLHLWAIAEVRALGFDYTVLDAEARAHRTRAGQADPLAFSGVGYSSNILRLVIKDKTKVNESSGSRAEYIYPAVKAYLLGGGMTIGIGGMGAEVSAGVGVEVDLSVFAETSHAGSGVARMGGAVDAYIFGEALGELDLYLFKLTVGAAVKIMDAAAEAPISAQDRQIRGAVDLIVRPFSAYLLMKLYAWTPYEVRVRVWTWRFWEWRIQIRWKWKKIASVTLFDYDMDGFNFRILDFGF